MTDTPTKRWQFSLATILVCMAVLAVTLALWTWMRDTMPGILAAILIVVWVFGLALIVSGCVIKLNDDWELLGMQIMVTLGIVTIFVGPFIVLFAWLFWTAIW